MKMEEKLSFREAQLGAYEILKFLDELCRKHKFRYFLMYGSLIGAVRNKGIIPWDDDVDIMMPRKDYDQLISYCREHGDDIKPFVLFENSLNINYPHPIARMSDSRYRLDFENEKDYGLGLFVDIYPLDGAGNNIKGAHKLVHKSYRNASLCFLTSRKKFGVDNTKSKMKMALKVPAYLWANAFHVCYNEQGCAYAADGFARTSGKLGVYFTTSGPGAVNGFCGLADAWFDGIPLMCISGNVPTNEQRGFSGVRQNGFQEMDVVSMTKHITKYSVAPNRAESFPDIITRAYNLATTGRKGGVVIDFPYDIQKTSVSGR